jgi:hypothetical protein
LARVEAQDDACGPMPRKSRAGALSLSGSQARDLRAPEGPAVQAGRLDTRLPIIRRTARIRCRFARRPLAAETAYLNREGGRRRPNMRRRTDGLHRQGRCVRGADQTGHPAARQHRPAFRWHIQLVETLIEQCRHVCVTLGVGTGTQYDTDEAHAAMHRTGDEIVPGRFGITCLHAVRARIGRQHSIVIEDHATLEGEAGRAEIGIEPGKVGQQVPGQDCQVAGSGPLVRVGQPRGVGKGCAAHA